jgi:hypothetical protein
MYWHWHSDGDFQHSTDVNGASHDAQKKPSAVERMLLYLQYNSSCHSMESFPMLSLEKSTSLKELHPSKIPLAIHPNSQFPVRSIRGQALMYLVPSQHDKLLMYARLQTISDDLEIFRKFHVAGILETKQAACKRLLESLKA